MKKEPTFEQAMQRLQALLERLQAPETPLADAIRLYAEAADLIAQCSAMLDTARLQVEEIDAALAKTMPQDEE